jgi:hypothetical protein
LDEKPFFKDEELNKEEFNIIFSSPDNKKLLLNRNSNGDWYVSDRHGNIKEKIEMSKLKVDFPQYQYLSPLNFSADSKEVVFRAANFDPPLDKKTKGPSKQTIGSFNFDNHKSSTLYTKEVPPIFRIFYDPQKKFLAYQTFEIYANFTTVDLNSGAEQIGVASELSNYTNGIWGHMGEYMVRFGGSPQVLEIISVVEPQKVLAKITAENGRYFEKYVNWTPDHQMFAVKYRKDIWGNDTYANFYRKDGSLVSSIPQTFDAIDPGMIFSPDDKYIMIWKAVAEDKTTYQSFQPLNIVNGKLEGKPFVLNPVGLPRFWIGNI